MTCEAVSRCWLERGGMQLRHVELVGFKVGREEMGLGCRGLWRFALGAFRRG